MSRPCLGTLLIGLTASGGIAISGPLEDASAAYQRGDYSTALQLIRPLAEKGDPAAQFRLGVMYEEARGVPLDYQEAVKWFRLAADRGNANGQYSLGVSYYTGEGVAKDDHEAFKWFRLATQQGDAFAQRVLGVMYEQEERPLRREHLTEIDPKPLNNFYQFLAPS
jgi:TPR repeat protein